jgi:hypothetical protein
MVRGGGGARLGCPRVFEPQMEQMDADGGVVGDRKKSSPSCDLRVGFRDDRSRDQNPANRRESSDDGGDLGRHA